MDAPLNFGAMFVNLAGGLALFLYGMHRMADALKILAGERVKNILSRLTRNRFTAAFAGAGVTALIQSSSITTVLVVGFITAGVMNFQQSIGVILGANVGTTITAQIIAFKITESALFLIATGFFAETLARSTRLRQYGSLFMGVGLLFFGMELMSQATAPLRTYEPFMALMSELQNPFLGVLIGAVFTALVQSSSATTGIVIVMGSQGLISLEGGIALILGSNVGTCVTAWISALGKPREAVQAAVAHVLFNVTGVLLFLPFITQLAELVRLFSPVSSELTGLERLAADMPRQLANAHTVFNVTNLLLFLGFTNSLAALVLRIVPPSPPAPLPETQPRYLDKLYLDTPALAFDRVRLELGRVGEKTLTMLRDGFPTLLVGTRERVAQLQQRDHEIDVLTDEIVRYLRALASGPLVEPQPLYLQQQLGFAHYLEKIADLVETGFVADANKRLDHGVEVSEAHEELLREIYKDLFSAAQTTIEAMVEQDPKKAKAVIASKKHIYGLIEHARSEVYLQLSTQGAVRLQVYKIESNALENFRRLHMMLRSICKLVRASPNTDPDDDNGTSEQGDEARIERNTA